MTADNGDAITIERGTNGTFEDLELLGFQESSEAGTVEGYGIATPTNKWGVGDVTINGVAIAPETSTTVLCRVKLMQSMM